MKEDLVMKDNYIIFNLLIFIFLKIYLFKKLFIKKEIFNLENNKENIVKKLIVYIKSYQKIISFMN
jgi:hypothetical protein